MTDHKRRLREHLEKIPMGAAERNATEQGIGRMSDAQAETVMRRIEFARDAAAFIIEEIDRLFGPEPVKGVRP